MEKSNKDILKEIVLEDGIDNISFGDNSFTIKLGDILNTETETGDQYYLLDTYVEVPYDFSPSSVRLHRGIINEFECRNSQTYSYSGFVHYQGHDNGFCYGDSGVNYVCSTIRDEGLDSDKFNLFLIKLKTFLSASSHKTVGGNSGYKKLDLPTNEGATDYKLIDFITINGQKYPSKILKTQKNLTVLKVIYDKPYKEVLTERRDKSFLYNNEVIIPKVVRHELEEDEKTIETEIRVDIEHLLGSIKENKIKRLVNEINNKRRITLQDLIHQLPNKHSRVDGSFYL